MNYRFKQLREDKSLTQAEVAKAIFIAQNTYSYYENGQRDIPTYTLIRLADFYNVSVDYILERTDNPELQK
ncbi:MAG: helix-turn-helix domain-containing protein [Oscillospiraceae bacterium]